MNNKTLLIGLVLVISVLIGGMAVTAGSDELLGEYEKSDKEFERIEIGDTIVYWYQRMIDDAIVEGDYIVYQFDKNTKELKKKIVHWRDDLPEHLPPVIPKEEAESMVKGKVLFTELYIISPDSVVFPLDPAPENPCWVVRSIDDNDNVIVTIIDAVDGKILGYGVPPPITGFSLSGPCYFYPCSGAWTAWYQNAESWFNTMGYPTEAVEWPTEAKVRSHIQSTGTAMFYEIAHGGSTSFASGCVDGQAREYTYASEIHDWIASYTKMPFTFIGSCGGMCDLSSGTFSYEFRKGSIDDTVTVGYCGMASPGCSNCWSNSLAWQTDLFGYMNQSWTVNAAFDQACADYPMCVGCMRFAGDGDFKVVPVVKRAEIGCIAEDSTVYKCGDMVVQSCTFYGDMSCPCPSGHGLEIGEDGIVIDGNGHKIDGVDPGTCSGYTLRSGIYNSGYDNVTIKNLDVKGFCDGILLKNCENNTIDNCEVHDNGNENVDFTNGIQLDLVRNSTIKNCKIYNNTGKVFGCAEANNGGMGISVYATTDPAAPAQSSHHNNITNNEIYNNHHCGIFSCMKCRHNYVADNYIHDNGHICSGYYFGGGIRLQYMLTNNWTVENNTIVNNIGPGIFVRGKYNTIISNNVSSSKNANDISAGCAVGVGYGIYLPYDSKYNNIYGNTFCYNNDTAFGATAYDICDDGTNNYGDENTCDTKCEGTTITCCYPCPG